MKSVYWHDDHDSDYNDNGRETEKKRYISNKLLCWNTE